MQFSEPPCETWAYVYVTDITETQIKTCPRMHRDSHIAHDWHTAVPQARMCKDPGEQQALNIYLLSLINEWPRTNHK